MFFLKRWLSELGRVLSVITVIEYLPIFFCMMVWLYVENLFAKPKREVLVRSKGHWETLNFISRLAFNLAGIRIEVEKSIENDLEDQPFILMATHSSILDVLSLLDYCKNAFSFPAKDSLFEVPLLKNVLKAAFCIPINREKLTEAKTALLHVKELSLREKRSVCIFFEGKRRRKVSESGRVNILPFKKGPFHLAKALEYDIVISIIVGGTRILKAGTLIPKPGTLYIKFLDRIKYSEIAHMDHNELREFIEKKTHENYFWKSDKEVVGRTKPNVHYVIIWLLFHYFAIKWLFSIQNMFYFF